MPPSFLIDDTRQKALGRFNFNQPGTFYHKKALEKMGTLNSKLHFVMDKEWWNRFLINVPSEKLLPLKIRFLISEFMKVRNRVLQIRNLMRNMHKYFWHLQH